MNITLISFFYSFSHALIATIGALFIALIGAHVASMQQRGWHLMMLEISALLSAIMPTKLCAQAIGWLGLKGIAGIIYAHIFLNAPFAWYVLVTTYRTIDGALLDAAHDLGATKWQSYRTIIMPLLKPTALSLASLIFIACFSSHAIPDVLNGYATCDILMQHAYAASDYGAFFMQWIMRLIVIVPCIFFIPRIHTVRGSYFYTTMPVPHALKVGALCCAAFLCAPLIALFAMLPLDALYTEIAAFMQIDMRIGTSCTMLIATSCLIAIISATGALVVSVLLIMLWHKKSVSLRTCSLLALMPLLCGGVLVASVCDSIAAYTNYASLWAIIGSHIIFNYPFTFRVLYGRIAAYNPEMGLHAQSLGASARTVLKTIMVPFMRDALIRAWCMGCALSITEVGAAQIMSGKVVTLAMAMRVYRACGETNAVQLCGMLMLVIAGIIGALGVCVQNKRLSSTF